MLVRKPVADQLGRAAADVDHDRARLQRSDPAKRHRGLLVAGEQPCREAVRPLDLSEERLAVLRVAHRARRDGERALRAERLELAPVVGERVAHARDRDGEEAAARVDPFAEPRDARAPHDLVDAPSSTSATRRRVAFVPRSIAATRVTSAG